MLALPLGQLVNQVAFVFLIFNDKRSVLVDELQLLINLHQLSRYLLQTFGVGTL